MTSRLESIPAALLRAADDPDSTRGYTFLADGGNVDSFVSFAELGCTVARYASAFRRAGLRLGERVGLILPENAHFIFSFFGCMHAGIIPVPIAPPMNIGKLGSFLEHVRHIVKKSECAMLLTSPRIKSVLGGLLGSGLRSLLTVDELEIDSDELPLTTIRGNDTAFLQFTSGSTAQPRGVALTHDNLSENAHCITRLGIKLTRDDVGCSWLPLFHDMGLIGFVISPLVTATPIVLMSPLSFVKRPGSWLRMMSEHRGTISFGPNFAYGLCVKRVKESELEGIDLSRWRVAGCGARADSAANAGVLRRAFFRSRIPQPCLSSQLWNGGEHPRGYVFPARSRNADRHG
jgi:fatty-acyl-CoA synthase